MMLFGASCFALLYAPQTALADDDGGFTLRGSVGVEARVFAMRPAYPLQATETVDASLTASAKASWSAGGNGPVIDVAPFLRLDSLDDNRTHFDLREASLTLRGSDIDLRVGVSKVFWGVTEARHLVDIVNQTDLVEEPEGEQKLGQPMVMIRGRLDDFEATALVLPFFRKRTFPGDEGRLRTQLPIDDDHEIYESDEGADRVDFAGRVKGRFGDFDVGLSYFNGTSREPRFIPVGGKLVPAYDVIDQVGLDVQATLDSTLLKLEAITRDGHQGPGARRFSAVVLGVEETISQFAGTEADIGLIVEFTWDDRPASAPPTIYDKDIFAGARLAFNDTSDSYGLFGALFDLDKESIYAKLEGSTRLNDDLRLELEGQFVLKAGDRDAVLRQVRNDSFMTVRLLGYF